MDKTTASTLRKTVKSGNFSAALDIIQQNSTITTDNAIMVFILTVSACGDCPPQEKLDENALILLLEMVLKQITNPSSSQLLSYCQSIFYIFKYFLDRKSYETAAQIESILSPKFLIDSISLETNQKAKSTFSLLLTTMSNSIFRLSQEKNESYNENLIKFSEIILKTSSLINSKTDVLKLATKLVTAFCILHINSAECVHFYKVILDLYNVETFIDNTGLLFLILDCLIAHFLKNKNFQEIRLLLCESKLFDDDETWKSIHIVLETVLICSPDYAITEKNFEKWKSAMENFKTQNKILYNQVILTIASPLRKIFNYYKTEIMVWHSKPKEKVQKILKVINIIVNDLTFLQKEKECSCGSNCPIQTNHYAGISLGILLLNLANEYVHNNTNCPKEFYGDILSYVKNLLDLVEPLKNNCLKWTQPWKEMACYIYNIGTALYLKKYPFYINFYKIVCKYYYKYDTESSVLKDTMLEYVFNTVCNQHLNDGDMEGAMTFCAFYCLAYPKERNLAFVNWFLKPKSTLKDKPERAHYSEWTLASILEKNKSKLHEVVESDFSLTKTERIDLLCFELTQYKAKYPSKLPMMIALKQLLDIADSETLAKTVFQIYGEGNVSIHEEMPQVFAAIRARFKTEPDYKKSPSLQLGLAILYYYKYKILSKDVANKNVQAMENTMVMEKKETVIEGIPKDANDECDIVSVYEELRINVLSKLLDILNESLTSLALAADIGVNDSKFAGIAHSLAISIGFEYKIHCFGIKSLQAFETSLKFADLSQNQEKQLISLSFLIESGNINSDFVRELIRRAEQLEANLSIGKENEFHKCLIIYYIQRAKAFLYTNSHISYDSCKKAEVLLTNNKGNSSIDMLKADWLVVMYKLTKSCELKGEEHIREPMTTKLHKANDIVMDTVLNTGMIFHNIEPHQQFIFLDVILELTKAYYLMKSPRDLRCYSKNSILLAQKLVLPLRCVSFLVCLAQSDLLCCKFDDCNTKINGINDILSLQNSRQNLPLINKEQLTKFEEKGDFGVDRLSYRIQELALDVPKHYRQHSPSSPNLVVEGFKAPAYILHNTSCTCFSCVCVEQNLLLLEKIRLDALLSSYRKQNNIADEFLQGAIILYKKLKNDFECYKAKAKQLISEGLIFNFEEKFMETYSYILLDYSFHLARIGRKEKALEVNLQLLQMLKLKKQQLTYLYTEALLQRLSYLSPKPAVASIVEVDTLSVDSKGDALSTTPKNKQNEVIVNVSHHVNPSPPKRRLKKVALFENFTSEDSGVGPKDVATPCSKDNRKANKISYESTPMLGENIVVNTPKVQILTDKKTTKSQKKKLTEFETDPYRLTPEMKHSLTPGGSSSRNKEKKSEKEVVFKVVPSIKKNLLSQWAVPSVNVKTYARIKKTQQSKDLDLKKPIQIYSDDKPTKSMQKNETKTSDILSSTLLEDSKKVSKGGETTTTKTTKISSTLVDTKKVPKNKESATTASRREPKIKYNKTLCTEKNETINAKDIKSEPSNDDLTFTSQYTQPVILAGCSASKSKRKKETANLNPLKKNIWATTDLSEDKSVADDLNTNLDRLKISRKLNTTQIKIDKQSELQYESSETLCRININAETPSSSSSLRNTEKKVTENEKKKPSTRLKTKKETSSTNSCSSTGAVRKSSRNRVL